MDIVQEFYDNLAQQYDKLYPDWDAAAHEHAAILNRIFQAYGFDESAHILDCACGIGTQTIGLAALGYSMTASDISTAELKKAQENAVKYNADVRFAHADFCALSETFSERFEIIIAMDNALPHLLTKPALEQAVRSIIGQMQPHGIFVASIRDYDALLKRKPPYAPPYIHQTAQGQRVCFQTWNWKQDNYHLVQYIIEDAQTLRVSKYECEYRAVRRSELTEILLANGCGNVCWKMPEETGFYQPIVIAQKT